MTNNSVAVPSQLSLPSIIRRTSLASLDILGLGTTGSAEVMSAGWFAWGALSALGTPTPEGGTNVQPRSRYLAWWYESVGKLWIGSPSARYQVALLGNVARLNPWLASQPRSSAASRASVLNTNRICLTIATSPRQERPFVYSAPSAVGCAHTLRIVSRAPMRRRQHDYSHFRLILSHQWSLSSSCSRLC